MYNVKIITLNNIDPSRVQDKECINTYVTVSVKTLHELLLSASVCMRVCVCPEAIKN